ncbi:MAG: shikimate kinase [Clostridia bacterium]|nr:shikimate kinase [Clostridia bacterium]
MKNNIILIGMPGSGKSTTGVLFAKAMNYRFLDVDFLIQEHEGKRLYEVIEEKGNDYFLQIEDKINAGLNVDRTVVATGGSVIYCENAMKHLKTLGTVIYLKVPEEEIERRITNFSTRGIIIKSGDSLKDLYNERIPLYEKYADLTVLCNEKELQYNADKMMNEYIKFIQAPSDSSNR